MDKRQSQNQVTPFSEMSIGKMRQTKRHRKQGQINVDWFWKRILTQKILLNFHQCYIRVLFAFRLVARFYRSRLSMRRKRPNNAWRVPTDILQYIQCTIYRIERPKTLNEVFATPPHTGAKYFDWHFKESSDLVERGNLLVYINIKSKHHYYTVFLCGYHSIISDTLLFAQFSRELRC